MDLSTAEQRVNNEAKSTVVAYLLWLVAGGIGAHRFYMGRVRSGVGMIALLVTGAVTAGVGIGALFIVALGVWLLVDLFLIPGMIRQHNDEVRNSFGKQVCADRLLARERAGR